MAGALVSVVAEQLASSLLREISLLRGLESDLEDVRITMLTIKAVLEEAEVKQVDKQLTRVWLTQLKDAYLDAEDLLDEFNCEKLRRTLVMNIRGGMVRFSSHIFYKLRFCPTFARKLKEIRERCDEIREYRSQFRLDEQVYGENRVMRVMREDSYSYYYVRDSDVIGRDFDKNRIIQVLVNADPDGNQVPIVSICGARGMGKTTLALLVYNNEKVHLHFHLKIWVCLSGGFDVPKIMRKILNSPVPDTQLNNDLSIDQLRCDVRRKLEERRFFLVLDHLSDDDSNKWMELMQLLRVGAKGSKILVTTSRHSIASHTGFSVCSYPLNGISREDCFSLFVKFAFRGEGRRPEKLMDIGKQIVEKCDGVPLMVITLGSMLISKLEERDWEDVSNIDLQKLKQKENISSHLPLSYYEMPYKLKQCFLYCSLFPRPRHQKIYSFELIQLWMAHGVLQSPDDNVDLEDVGEQRFDELCSRSLFDNVKKELYCSSFEIDDLALSAAETQFSIIESSTTEVPETVRHVSITYSADEVPACLDKLNNIRTILFPVCTVGPSGGTFIDRVIFKFKRLRMLDLSDSSFEMVPSYISSLKHLRYLDISRNERIEELPNSICKLQSLQTLKLVGCTKLKGLPRDTKNLISLRHLEITTTETCFSKNGIECLTSLQTLKIVSCKSLISLPNCLRSLNKLKILVMNDCEKLSLIEGGDDEFELLSSQTLIFENLPNMVGFPRWLQGCKTTLRYLRVRHCPNLTALPLWLTSVVAIKEIEIYGCPEIRSLPNGIHRLPDLQGISISECPILRDFVNTMSEDCRHKIHFED